MRDELGVEHIEGKLNIERRTLCHSYPIHYHSFFEFEYINSGDGTVYIDNKPERVTKGSLVFMTPYNFQSIKADTPLDIINVSFSSDHIEKSLLDFCEDSIILHDISSDYFFKLLNEFQNKYNFNYIVIKSILNILATEAIRKQTPEILDKNIDISYKIAFYIRRHYKKDLTIFGISKKFGYTPNYLCSIFKQHFNIPIKEYIIKFRLEIALKLLASTDLSVNEICYESGFTSLSNFLRNFKSKYGKTPTEARKDMNE